MLERKLTRFDHLRAERELDRVHWTFGRSIYQTDIDMLNTTGGLVHGETVRYEVDRLQILSVNDYKFTHDPDSMPDLNDLTWTKSIYWQIAQASACPYHLVLYTPGSWIFRIAEVTWENGRWGLEQIGRFDRNAYGRFLYAQRGIELPADHTFDDFMITTERFRTLPEVVEAAEQYVRDKKVTHPESVIRLFSDYIIDNI